MFTDLQEFVAVLKREKELVEITAPVSPYLEAAEIHRRIISEGGPALLFRNIEGASFPLVTNLFGTKRRIELAFGAKPEKFMREVAALPHEMLPPSLGKLWSRRALIKDLIRVGTRTKRDGSILESVTLRPKLGALPLLTTWEQDGGPFITLPLVYTEHPTLGTHNLGMYRLQRFDDSTTGLHCQIGKGGGFHIKAAQELGVHLPVHVYIGGPPALILSAIAPLPENVPELLLASLVQGKKLEFVKNPFSTLPLLANAEFALIGHCNPQERRPEGPFGDHYGYYSLQHDYPVFHCTTMLHRKNALCTATVVGKPRQEDFYLGDYLQDLLSPLFPVVMPSVRDLWSYGETGYHSLAAAVVRERYKREAMMSAFRILGEGQLSLTKFLLVLDEQRDLRDFRATFEHVLERADFRTDLYIFSNLSMDTLDYTGPSVNEGSKGVLLGVGEPIRKLPVTYASGVPSGVKEILPFCRGCLVVEGPSFSAEPQLAARIVQEAAFSNWPFVVLVDDAKFSVANVQNFLWQTFTRFEPGADIFARNKTIQRNHISYEAPLVIDARMKPHYPEELFCDAQTKNLVDKRWGEYFRG